MPDPNSAVSASGSSKFSISEMRSKLVAMKKDQGAMSQKLTVLAEKRKQEHAAPAASQLSKKMKKAPLGIAVTHTCLQRVFDALAKATEEHIGPYDSWCTDVLRTIDSHILQPLAVVDGVGVPSAICPSLETDIQPATCESGVPAATPRTDGPVSPPLVSTDLLLAAARELPTHNICVLRTYVRDARNALEALHSGDKTIYVRNTAIVQALLPVWRRYGRLFAATAAPDGPLHAVLRLEGASQLPIDDGPAHGGDDPTHGDRFAGYAITRKERVFVLRLVERDPDDLPILAHCIAHSPRQSAASSHYNGGGSATRSFRYFDIAGPAGSKSGAAGIGQPSTESKSGSPRNDGPSDSGGPTTADAACTDAAQDFWKGIAKFDRPVMEHEIYSYLRQRTNKDVGRTIKMLKHAVQLWPDSERLWDVYLELYTRQRVPPEEAVAAFADATKFHPHSMCLWRRYVVWCGWNAAHKKGADVGETFHIRLAMVTAMAIKLLASAPVADQAEQISATVAELIIYYWDSLWQGMMSPVLAADAGSGRGSHEQNVARLLAHMHNCLTASSLPDLLTEISTMRLTQPPEEAPTKNAPGRKWSSSKWVLAGLLLPHHLLAVGQVYASCSITAEHVPRPVLERLVAALHARGSRQSVYFINLDNSSWRDSAAAGDRQAPKPGVATAICNVLGGILRGLQKPTLPQQQGRFNEQTLGNSKAVCLASIKATIAQLQQSGLADAGSQQAECEQILWSIRSAPTSGVDLRRVLELMAGSDVCKFLLISQALCTGPFPGDATRAAQLVDLLWDHAVLVAKDAGIDAVATECPGACLAGLDGEADTAAASNLQQAQLVKQRIADTRALYYRLLGYAGQEAPASLDALKQGLADIDGASDDVSVFRDRIRCRAGVWTNIALVEMLHDNQSAESAQPVGQSAVPAVLWLRCGLEHLATMDAGSRAQVWALLFRLTMTQRPLDAQEIAAMGRDLVQPTDANPVQTTQQCYALVNFVLQAVLLAVPSDETLAAIANYLAADARANWELAIR
ncbi:hypothetical protein LPJ61_001426 [Coemansia biformis]|uniref:Uncharacterized protein n=1 Tax=Coemansia biformis TaxID=1286918 RepID=A0A9W7YGF8_9FUNG|nr:hypothetical protein LPJ61_001426 [Coemansia biformis]